MKNEIDKTVERIGQLPEIITVTKLNEGFADIRSDDLKNLANAYTQLKADLAMFRVQMKRIAKTVINTRLEHPDLTVVSDMAIAALLLEKIEAVVDNGSDLAQQTLAAIGKE